MPKIPTIAVMPTKMKYKFLIGFCLMSLLPILIGIYMVSQFVQFPFDMSSVNLVTLTLVTLFSLTLSFLGYRVTREMISPIMKVAASAQKIAEGKLEQATDFTGADEIEDLSRSLRTISLNARELLDKVDRLTLKDKLTGLYNASYIRERLNEEIQRAIHYQSPCSFAYFMIDRFKEYAASLGQQWGDETLKSMAGILNSELTEFDRAGRISNDEFGVIFFDKNKKKTIEMVQRIQKRIAGTVFKELKPGELTVSVGISENPLDGVLAADLFSKAQNRVKSARQKGLNVVEAFE